ncbi:MAG: hypothetical protein H7175_00285 [Burkholderiales bacterium]|nr:hypothetical protein [Anaerolineae bacterium]
MSDQPPPKRESALTNPQIIATIIGGIITLIATVVGILPNLLDKSTPQPTQTPIVVTATKIVQEPTWTLIPPTATDIPFTTTPAPPSPTPLPIINATQPHTALPTAITIEPFTTEQTLEVASATHATGNIRLLYDDATFSLVNVGDQTVSLEGIVFRSDNGEWPASRWGRGIYDNLLNGMCLRLRDAQVGSRQPPPDCNNLGSLQVVGSTALFWVGISSFEVILGDEVIATCVVDELTCSFAIETPANPIPLDG